MSLLLDALKKAADDKAKTSRGESLDPQRSTAEHTSVRAAAQAADELRRQTTEQLPEPASAQSSAQLPKESSDIPELTLEASVEADELTLDVDKDGQQQEQIEIKTDRVENDSRIEARGHTPESHEDSSREERRPDTRHYTVSDGALSLLIDKTNRDVKQRRKIYVASVVVVSLIILLSGGLYYYTDMQAEIAGLERKHQIAMQSMRLKTRSEKTPDKSAIIRNLVSDTGLEEKVQYAKAHMASEQKAASRRTQYQPERTKKIAAAEFSIKRTNKSDPVGDKLDVAWSAYESGNYDEAKQLYRETLNIESSNRDAQLGLGAIAVIEKDDVRARKIYMSLLQQDPRDPIASAALAGLSSDEASLKSENDYLISLLETNPDAPHLNFSVGNNYAQQQQWKAAQQYYFKAWQFDNENADYIFNLAISMDQLGKQHQALGFYRDSLTKSKNKQVSFSREAVQKRITELSEL